MLNICLTIKQNYTKQSSIIQGNEKWMDKTKANDAVYINL